MYVAKYHGLDLPEFSPERQLYCPSDQTKRELIEGALATNDTFLRFCRTQGPEGESLQQRLDRATSYFIALEEHCQLQPFNFRYGLYPKDGLEIPESILPQFLGQGIVPDKFVLAAEVPAIRERPLKKEPEDKDTFWKSYDAMEEFKRSIAGQQGSLIDVCFSQTMHGVLAMEPENSLGLYYVDPEPLMAD